MPDIGRMRIVIESDSGEVLKGFAQIKKSAKGTSKDMQSSMDKAAGGIKSKIRAAARDGAKRLKSMASNARRSFGRIGQAAKQVAMAGVIALTAAIAGAVVAMKKLSAAASVQEDAEEGLAAALRNSGSMSERNMKILKDYAAQIQSQTKYGDELILQQMAYAKNLGVSTDQMKGATKAAAGLAAKYKVDLKTAMMLVGRAAVGETGQLKRYGIILDDNATDQERFNELLKIGADSFGLAEEEAATFSGRMEQLGNTVGDFMEALGKLINDTILANVGFENIMESIQGVIARIKEFGQSAEFAELMRVSIDSVAQVGRELWLVFEEIMNALTGVNEGMSDSEKKMRMVSAAGGVLFGVLTMIRGVSAYVATVWNTLKIVFNSLVATFSLGVAAVLERVQDLAYMIDGMAGYLQKLDPTGQVKKMSQGLKSAADSLTPTINRMNDQYEKFSNNAGDNLRDIGETWKRFGAGTVETGQAVSAAVTRITKLTGKTKSLADANVELSEEEKKRIAAAKAAAEADKESEEAKDESAAASGRLSAQDKAAAKSARDHAAAVKEQAEATRQAAEELAQQQRERAERAQQIETEIAGVFRETWMQRRRIIAEGIEDEAEKEKALAKIKEDSIRQSLETRRKEYDEIANEFPELRPKLAKAFQEERATATAEIEAMWTEVNSRIEEINKRSAEEQMEAFSQTALEKIETLGRADETMSQNILKRKLSQLEAYRQELNSEMSEASGATLQQQQRVMESLNLQQENLTEVLEKKTEEDMAKMKENIGSFLSFSSGGFSSFINDQKSKMGSLEDIIEKTAKGAADKWLQNLLVMKESSGNMLQDMGGLFRIFGNNISQEFSGIFNNLKSSMKSIGQGFSGLTGGGGDGFLSSVGGILGGIGGLLGPVGAVAGLLGGGLFGGGGGGGGPRNVRTDISAVGDAIYGEAERAVSGTEPKSVSGSLTKDRVEQRFITISPRIEMNFPLKGAEEIVTDVRSAVMGLSEEIRKEFQQADNLLNESYGNA